MAVKEDPAAQRAKLRRLLTRLDKVARKNLNGEAATIKLRWYPLSQDLGVSLYTVEDWARKGRVPEPMAKAIEQRYGRSFVKAEDLIV